MQYDGHMNKLQQKKHSGFSIVETVIVMLILGAVVAAGLFIKTRHDNNKQDASAPTGGNTQQSSGSGEEADLVLYNFGIKSLDSMDVTTQATRDFKASGHKGFYIFGDILPGTPVRHNPNFEFASVKEGTDVIAAIDGVVGFVKEQADSKDAEVFLMTNEQSNWVIGYDHLVDLKVKKGDSVKVGQVLGSPARQNNGLLRFEFQVNKNKDGQDGTHICPTTLLDQSIRASWEKQLIDVQNAWESISGLELYDTAKQSPAGCLMKDMTPAFAQGTSQ